MLKFTTMAAAAAALLLGSNACADDMFAGVQVMADDNGGEAIVFERLDPAVMRMSPGEQVDLNFGPGYVAELDRVGTQEMGGRVWAGRIAGRDINNRVMITETNGFVFGRVNAPDGVWYIIPEGAGHRIMQMPANARILPFEGEDPVLPTAASVLGLSFDANAAEADTADAVPVGSNGTLDLAIFYSQSFSAQWGLATGGRVQYLLALLDQALIDSDTGLRARLVHLDSVNLTTDTADQGRTLSNLAGFDNPTQDLSALRNAGATYGADLVAILQRCWAGQQSAGLAYLLGGNDDTIDPGESALAYSVSADWIDGADTDLSDGFGLCQDYTFAHEIGHNMGFAHNVEDAGGTPGEGVRPFAHGHRVDGVLRTIMAYGTADPNEAFAPYFSNPSLNLCGPNGDTSCGIAAPGEVSGVLTNDPADNARAAREESIKIVNFRAEIPRVVSAVLPVTRSVQNNTAATAFATIINPAASGSTANGCGLRLAGATGAQFSYQTTSAANALTGTANTPVSIPAGQAQNFVFSVTSTSDFTNDTGTPVSYPSFNDERVLFIEAFCADRRSAEYTVGLNSLTFSSAAAAPADVVALAATVGNTGRVEVPTTGNQVGVFSVAVSNVGTSASITATADTGATTIAGITAFEICRTDPNTGACTTPRADSQTLTLNQNDTATFGVFVRGNGTAVANDPARNRVFVRFSEGAGGGAERGATSVAVRTQ